jgi:hypothetical protein
MNSNDGPKAQNGINSAGRENVLEERARSFTEPPPWLATSAAEFGPTQRILNVVRPIRALSFGGFLVFSALLGFLFDHSPNGQSVLLIAALCGLPLSLAAWFVASRVQRRLKRKKNHIEARMYEAGLHLADDGRVLTDNPHPVLILDPARRKKQISS